MSDTSIKWKEYWNDSVEMWKWIRGQEGSEYSVNQLKREWYRQVKGVEAPGGMILRNTCWLCTLSREIRNVVNPEYGNVCHHCKLQSCTVEESPYQVLCEISMGTYDGDETWEGMCDVIIGALMYYEPYLDKLEGVLALYEELSCHPAKGKDYTDDSEDIG